MNKIKGLMFVLFLFMSFLLVACGKEEVEDFGILNATGFDLNGTSLSIEVSSLTASYTFTEKITVTEDATWELYTDQKTKNKIDSKTIDLSPGENTFYIKVIKGKESKLYTVTITKLDSARNTLAFNANGGEGNMESISAEANDSIRLPKSTFSKLGYRFAGWATSEDGAVEYLDEATFIMGELDSYTLYAKWEIESYSLVLIRSKITAGTVSGSGLKEYNSEVEIKATSKPGYTFLGWYDGDEEISTEAIYTFTMPANALTYEAVWKGNESTLVFNANTGEGDMSSILVEVGKTIALPKNEFIKEGYNFLGWATSKDGDVEYLDEANYKMGLEENPTLYAKWKVNSYRLELTKNIDVAGNVFGSGMIEYNSEVEIEAVSNLGYTFLGWYEGNTLVSESLIYRFTMPYCYVNYEARWEVTPNAFLGFSLKEDNTYEIIGYSGVPTMIIIGDTFDGKAITSIKAEAFSDCNTLTSINIPDNITSIEERAFRGCYRLSEIYISENVTNIGENAFSNCGNLIVYVEAETKPAGWSDLWCGSTTTVIWGYLSNGISDDGFKYALTLVGGVNNAIIMGYEGTKINLVIPSSIENSNVTSIATMAFANKSHIASVVISENVKTIAYYAFRNCSSLTSVTIPSSVITIEKYAFSECSNLPNIYIPSTVVNMGTSVFSSCSNLIIYTELPSRPSTWDSSWNSASRPVIWNCKSKGTTDDELVYVVYNEDSNDNVVIIGYNGTSAELNIPDKILGYPVVSISNSVFDDNETLTNITIPSTVTSIGDYAFAGCVNLTNFDLPEGLISIGRDAFAACYCLTELFIPASVTTMGAYITSSSTSLTIYVKAETKPSGWSNLWNSANRPVVFGYVSKGVTTDGVKYGVSLIDSEYSVVITGYTTSLVDTIVLDTIEGYPIVEISGYAFAYHGLKSIVLPSTVTTIGGSAFMSCYSLENITMSKNIVNIGAYAFAGCHRLVSIVIPLSATNLKGYIFNNCSKLTIYCEATSKPSEWNAYWNAGNNQVVWGYTGE